MGVVTTSSPAKSIFRYPRFVTYWGAVTLVVLAKQIRILTIPLIAMLELGASAIDVGLIVALAGLPKLVLGLSAGPVIDRFGKYRVVLATSAAQIACLWGIPFASYKGLMSLELLFVFSFFIGLIEMYGDAAHDSYLPLLLPPHLRLEGNSRLTWSSALGICGGRIASGVFFDLVSSTASMAIAGALFVFAQIAMLFLDRPQEHVFNRGVRESLNSAAKLVFRHPKLGVLVLVTGFLTFGLAMSEATKVLFYTRELAWPATIVGTITGLGAMGTFVGPMVTHWANKRLSLLTNVFSALFMILVSAVLIPSSLWASSPLALILLAHLLNSTGSSAFYIHLATVRHNEVSDDMQVSVASFMNFVFGFAMTAGAMAGGQMAHSFSLRSTLWGVVPFISLAAISLLYLRRRTALTESPVETSSSAQR